MKDIFSSNISGVVHTNFNLEELNESYINESVAAREALRKIKSEKNKKTIEEEARDLQKKFKREENLYEEYSETDFDSKLRVDSLFYDHILSNLPDTTKNIEEAVASFYKTIKEIYETINIKPESHKLLTTNILVESVNDQSEIFDKIIHEHLNNHYYRYTLEQRKQKFMDQATPHIEEMIQEGVQADEAISFAVKTVILESLVKNISMPRLIQKRVEYLCEDADYGKVFDQEHLKHLWSDFNHKANNMAKIMAIAI